MFFLNKKTGILIVIAAAMLSGGRAVAQNVNVPNKTGPLNMQVNTLSGNLYIPRTDLFISSRGMDISLNFYYNSFAFDQKSGYGNGWSGHYGISYRNDTLNGKTITWGDGSDVSFTFANNAYVAPTGNFALFTEYQPNKFLFKTTGGMKFFFDNSQVKKITRMEDRSGNFLNFTYTDTLLTAITNAAGQAVTLAYNAAGNLATVTDAVMSPARSYTYSYDNGGNLTQVTDPLGGIIKYTYLVNGPMKSATDKNANVADIIYYPDYTVSEMIGCNKRLSFSYDTVLNTTTATDYIDGGANQVTKYTYQKIGDSYWLAGLTSNCCGYNMNFVYDGQGNKIKETDANGNVTQYTYDSHGNALSIKDALNQVTTFTYSADFNRITSSTDAKGFTTFFVYDPAGNLIQLKLPGNLLYTATYAANGDIISSTDPNGNTYHYTYDTYGRPAFVSGPHNYHGTIGFDARGNLVSFTDGRGFTTTMQYDILNRLKKALDPSGQGMSVSYDAQSNPTVVTNQKNAGSTVQYDASNRPAQVSDALHNKFSFSYDAMNNITVAKNALNNTTAFTYDTRNRLSTMQDAEGNTATVTYDGKGNLTSLALPGSEAMSFSYDGLDRIKTASDVKGSIANVSYDANSNISSLTNGTGAVTSATYDSVNRLRTMTDPLGNSTSFVYDRNGNIISVTDRAGKQQNFTYDSLDRIKTYTDENGFLITPAYDAESNVISLKDQNNNSTVYTYDSLERVKTMTYPDGKFLQYSYDSRDNVIAKKLADGSTITYGYDSLDRAVTKTLPGGQVFTYGYDALDRVISATNSAGTVFITYDALNRILSESYDGRTTRYAYDIPSRTQSIIYPDSTIITKAYDVRGNMVSISKNNSVVVSYQYNNRDQMTAQTFANGVTSSMQYDIANRLSNFSTGNGVIQNTALTYDNDGNKTSISRLNNPAKSEQYTYDNSHRITGYKVGTIGGTPVLQNSYSFDALGNRVTTNINGAVSNYVVNNLNQITAITGAQAVAFTYDNNGNVTYDGHFHKTYDAEGRLIKDSASASNVTTYVYDALERRVQKIFNGMPLKYSYAGNEQIEERDGVTNAIRVKTIFRNFLTPVMNEKNGNSYFIHQNELNSVEAITNGSGALAESYSYDLYGKQIVYDASGNAVTGSQTGNRFGFTGQQYDSAVNGYHFYFRDYNPETGTFAQRDLIGYGDGMGMYQYVHNNPANGIDVLGLEEECESKEHHKESETKEWWEFIHHSSHILEWLAEHKEEVTAEKIEELMKFIQGEQSTWAALRSKGATVSELRSGVQTVRDANNALRSEVTALNGTLKSASSALGGLEKLASGLNVLDAIYKGYEFLHAERGEESHEAAVELSRSFLNFNPAGGAFNVVDWAGGKYIKKLTGEESEGIVDFTKKQMFEYYSRKYAGDADYEYFKYMESQNKLREFFEAREKRETREKEWEESHKIAGCPQNEDHAGPQKKKFYHYEPNGDSTEIVQAHDPNLIIGPEGVPQKAWVSVHDRMPYTILYENSKSASAPAKFVRITTPIEAKADPNTFRLGTFGFNNQTFSVPNNVASYYQRLDVRDSLGLYVDVTAGYDQMHNLAFWEFQSIDPTTLLPPSDPLKGFLLLQDSSKGNNGRGFVNFSFVPKQSDVTLDTIAQKAAIVFDTNDTIPTNTTKNTIDAFAPSSQMNSLPPASNNPVVLSWSGQDDPGGSGVWYYTLYVSTDGVNYNIVNSHITHTDTTFTGQPNTSYSFFVLATDSVGNTEVLGPGHTVTTFIGSVLPVTWLHFSGITLDKDNVLDWSTATEQNSKDFTVQRSLNAVNFIDIATEAAAGNSSTIRNYEYRDRNIDKLDAPVMYYRIKQTDLNGASKLSNIVRLTYNVKGTANSIVYPNPTEGLITVTIGDASLIGTNAVLLDANGRLLQNVKVAGNSFTIDLGAYTNGTYFIRLSNKEVLRVIKL